MYAGLNWFEETGTVPYLLQKKKLKIILIYSWPLANNAMKGGISKLNICSAQANKKSRYPVFETAGYRYSPKTSIRCLAKNVNTEDSIH